MDKFLEGSEKIHADGRLKKRVRGMVLRHRFGRAAKTIGCSAAALMICVAAGANIFPDMAAAMEDVPVLGSIVRAVTLEGYHNTIGGSDADIVTPQLEGLADTELMKHINKELGGTAEKLKQEFEHDAKELAEEYGDDAHMGFTYDYNVLTDTDDYYVLDVFYINTVGSSSTTHKFYTIDRKKRSIVTLGGLFKDGANYCARLSDIIKAEMIRRNEEEDGMFWVDADEFSGGFEGISPQQNFYINSDGNLVICFDKYEVAAGAQGCPEFVIERSAIADILS